MITILEKIVADKRIEVEKRKLTEPLASFINNVVKTNRDFYTALSNAQPAYILECKPKSPSKGVINPNFNLSKITKAYAPFATAISVLTDKKYFGGSYENFKIVREYCDQPLLCKDFIIDEYQIYYARLHDADAILLMLSVLNDEEYLKLRDIAHNLQMGVLTETSNEAELDRAIALNAKVIGINNRDLHTLTVDLNVTKKLAKKIPSDHIVISESGISSHENVIDLMPYVNGFLVGSHLVASHNIEFALRDLIFGQHKVCGINNSATAQIVFDNGGYYGGLIFVESSPRYISVDEAKPLTSVPLNFVGIFRDADITEILNAVNALNLYAVQLHGTESIAYIDELKSRLPLDVELWKAIDMSELDNYTQCLTHDGIDCFVLDNRSGGSGECFNWQLLDKLPKRRYLLAGGIGLGNITEALKQNISGVDMNSALESSQGIKCPKKIQSVFKQIREFSRN